MNILHISAECYPAAKAGGLGDVVGALPKYLNKAGATTSVIIPKYATNWLNDQMFCTLYEGMLHKYAYQVPFRIQQVEESLLGFTLYVVDLPGMYDRPGIYVGPHGPYADETERAICFQEAVLQWLLQLGKTPNPIATCWAEMPDVLHCHDHHTGLIPFMIRHCPQYSALHHLPTVFTIHNGAYQGAFSWHNQHLLPPYYGDRRGLLDWNDAINPLASAIKCCWRLTTVSQGYMEELRHNSGGLEWLVNNEMGKSKGIINGIDTQVWDPKTDPLIEQNLKRSLPSFKAKNKAALKKYYQFEDDLPVITFIGRLVSEKGAALLPELIGRFLQAGGRAAFLLLGTGDPRLEGTFWDMKHRFTPYFDARLEYNEQVAHQLYAGSDFLLMPSKIEPCGLNQMFALRYGTIPIVRRVGGLKDSILDIGFENGYGLCFDDYTVSSAFTGIARAAELYADKKAFEAVRKRTVKLDFSWERSTSEYLDIYHSLIGAVEVESS